MSIPVFLDNDQIKQIIDLVTKDMEEYLGYHIRVLDISQVGEDLNLRLYDVWSADFTPEVEKQFQDRYYERMLEVAGIRGAGDPVSN